MVPWRLRDVIPMIDALVSQKEVLPFTRDEGWSAWVAGVDTMGLGPRR